MTPGDPRRVASALGVERAVLCAPMAFVAGGRLAASVSAGGGLGFVGAGYGDREWLARQMELADDTPVGVGVITWNLADGVLDDILTRRPRAVWLSFGDPAPHLGSIREAGVVAVCQVGTVTEAVAAAEAGADMLVAQGAEAGGHGRGARSLKALIPAVRQAVPQLPLVATGAITDLAGYAAALALGADGIAMGTRFYATPEALDSRAAKDRLIMARSRDTVRSRVYDHVRGPVWPEGFSGRTLRTAWTDAFAGYEEERAADLADLRDDHRRAVEDDEVSIRAIFAGDGVDSITTVESATDLTRRFPAAGSGGS